MVKLGAKIWGPGLTREERKLVEAEADSEEVTHSWKEEVWGELLGTPGYEEIITLVFADL